MGLFDIFKKKPETVAFVIGSKATVSKDQTVQECIESQNVNSLNEPLDKLVNGDLPWGWITHNKDFIDKISSEYSYFLDNWIDTRSKSPKELYSSLKAFVLYMEDVEKLCKSKGECFEFWFYEILTGKNYLTIRKSELRKLEENLFEKQKVYEERQKKLLLLEDQIIQMLQAHDGILQSNFRKLFDESVQADVSNILYALQKDGKLNRTKSGRSYLLHFKE